MALGLFLEAGTGHVSFRLESTHRILGCLGNPGKGPELSNHSASQAGVA